jgi:hypothetical protein
MMCTTVKNTNRDTDEHNDNVRPSTKGVSHKGGHKLASVSTALFIETSVRWGDWEDQRILSSKRSLSPA